MAFNLKDSQRVAVILKMAFRATRQATYSHNGDEHIVAVRSALATADGTNATDTTIAKAIVEIVKNDIAD